VNLAQGKRQSAILFAEGEAQAILHRAKASADGIRMLSKAISDTPGGQQAASLRVAEQWVSSWKEMARSSNTIVVPANASDASSMVTTAMSIFGQVGKATGATAGFDGTGGGHSNLPSADGRTAAFGMDAPPEGGLDGFSDAAADTDAGGSLEAAGGK